MSKLVYLSGAIGRLSYQDAIAWRRKATKILAWADIGVLNPMRGKEHLADLEVIPAKISEDAVGWIGKGNFIVHRDLMDIEDSDALLVELTDEAHPYRGTICEIWEARARNKPVVVWSSWAQDSPWLAYAASIVCETLEECCDAIKELLL